MKKKSKGKELLRLVLPLLAAAVALWSAENYTVKVNRLEMVNARINEPIRLTVLSDLHSVCFGKDNENLKGLVKMQQPDLIFVLGDMYSKNDGFDTAVDFTTSLAQLAPVYFVSGDHDYDEKYFERLEDGGVNVLNFEKSDITVNGNELTLYGIRSEWFSDTFDLNNAFGPADKDRLNILLAHCPFVEKYESFDNLDFIFAADTHGGIIRFPFIGPLYYEGSFLPAFTYRGDMYDKGFYDLGDTVLFVTSGLGDYPLPVRFNNRPEIVSITLKGE